MLKIQRMLKKAPLEKIIDKYTLRACYHPTDDRVILNYTKDSPKLSPIVKECRGLVLNKQTGDLVARAFSRFFNVGEVRQHFKKFNWSAFECQQKHDGSLILLYYWNGEWAINTRGSFGDGKVNESEKTWHDLFYMVIPKKDLEFFDKRYTYIFELVGPYNKVVRSYKQTDLILLSIFQKEKELSYYDYMFLANSLHLKTPENLYFSSIKEIEDYVMKLEENDPTNEGVVICDDANRRWKIKNKRWFDLSRLKGETGNLFHPKHLLPFILKTEHNGWGGHTNYIKELLTYFPEAKECYYKYDNKIWTLYEELDTLWKNHSKLESQKDFALAIKHHPLAGILFNCRSKGIDLDISFKQSEQYILREIMK